MQIPIEQLLNLSDIQVLNVEITEREIKYDVESTSGYSIWRRCRQKAPKIFEHGETLTLRHLPICEKDVYLHLRTKRYRCLDCDGCPTTTERCEWYDADAKCTKAFAEFLLRELVNSTISGAAERALRPAVIARKVSQCSKNELDNAAFSAFKSVIGTLKKGGGDMLEKLTGLIAASASQGMAPANTS